MDLEEFAADITAAEGFLAAGGTCGLKPSGRPDIGGIVSVCPATAAGTFTTNKVKAAPVLVCQEVLEASGRWARAIVFNSGNANAATGAQGVANARRMQRVFAEGPGAPYDLLPRQVFVASTGVIGVPLDMEKVERGIRALAPTREGGRDAVAAMMTTDTVPKTAAARFAVADDRRPGSLAPPPVRGAGATDDRSDVGRRSCTVAGMAKGAAMIAPHMATMLAFVGTDAAVEPAYLQQALSDAVESSFNMVVIDGDMSTNDTALLLANGAAWPEGLAPLDGSQPACAGFEAALQSVCRRLAQAMARDGEGATKLVEVRVRGAASGADARRVARAIAGSNLTKAAVLGADPNWGRIACAAGYACAELDPDTLDIWIGRIQLVAAGTATSYDAAAASREMQGTEVRITVDLHLGGAAAQAWGCDLTPEYVRLNSEYTT
jgi:glutamate N-acetyltransferase/amino-acid N-acetyltransferase